MKEYLVFIGEDFYPVGGWNDLSGTFDTLDGSINHIKSFDPAYRWAHVVFQGKIVLRAHGEGESFEEIYWGFTKFR